MDTSTQSKNSTRVFLSWGTILCFLHFKLYRFAKVHVYVVNCMDFTMIRCSRDWSLVLILKIAQGVFLNGGPLLSFSAYQIVLVYKVSLLYR